MSSVVIKSEEIIVDTNEYNSDDLDEDLNLTFEDTGGEIYQQRVTYTKSIQHNHESSHGLASSTTVVTSQHHRNDMNSSAGSTEQNNAGSKSSAPKNILESEKRIRREIANSNERRRMQSINAGFQNLRALLPRHEGEKLSKAAILQQTSQYICDLENQKTQLLAQNSQLKRTLGQHELSLSGYGSGNGPSNTEEGCSAIKKRLGSVSPEPTTLLQTGTNPSSAVPLGLAKAAHGNAYITHSAKELLELKKQLEKERRFRAVIEEELRLIKRQLYNDNFITREVIEHTDNVHEENGTISYVALNEKNEPSEVVVCSSIEEVNDDCTEIISDENIHEEIIVAHEEDIKYDTSALQPILQAAIKAQPKVEVERINETVMKINTTERDLQPSQKKGSGNSIGLTRSRQNLETIVEAIRHLEGDHLFGESAAHQKKAQKSQESPLALTTKQLVSTVSSAVQPHHQQQQQRKTIAELSPFLQIKNPKMGSTNIVTIVRGGRSISLTPSCGGDNSLSISSVTNPSTQNISTANNMPSSNNSSNSNANSTSNIIPANSAVIPTAIVKVQPTLPTATSSLPIATPPSHITITTASLKQCRPGVIVAKQIS
ncbi:uncharacterized protein LOC129949587 isoform X2 [Eupeodes corollae]|uniref:uncharacterized protein LOC129949587 isoform X2 n=1 Tax=Eupeodes corollae TaxID=290404 RepID=UPI002491B51A|nr:uncharacterized protein LOC129949587 isoform X2 [Eupeodes corollae]